ncbi:MAG: flagellar motor protein MotB [Phaeovulum sp.]|uniref:flagellar motor protein MotB n=1 Tax=Phaeovulum sp. TaxID=2934796 RepID=UPI002734E84F|nr:flagellar motor protein MotB [Phaeovulum sp.]MDP3860016.1 flagellar motor protein MotB [Phaeovulum sp.]
MAARSNAAPVIIKRRKIIAGGGHHGGAWKVAYADFVTAMMAFFMLMWLLNATTEKQRKGIADYFNPTIAISRVSGGGEGAFGGTSVFSEEQIAQVGTGASAQRPSTERQAQGQVQGGPEAAAETAALADMQQRIDAALTASSGESMQAPELARHIVTRVTDEGLIVEFFDLDDAPLFAEDSATAEPITLAIATMLARVFALVGNEVAISGHVRSYPEMLRVNPEWQLSTERAQAFRGLLEVAGLDRARVQRVAGFADRKPAVRNVAAVRNNRIEVILLRAGR